MKPLKTIAREAAEGLRRRAHEYDAIFAEASKVSADKAVVVPARNGEKPESLRVKLIREANARDLGFVTRTLPDGVAIWPKPESETKPKRGKKKCAA